ncbi:Zn-dependent hydrolase oxidoreductase family [Mycena indigotica]|uniref:Zn-dependent hydrolase oxidoreductase family n=1 Tax=Mycena indigotica TaxID=2126181 RepID=A0A8H6RXP2_9AGAR|nr:Zn-dependent hydrolase oxidoreductase family [Mycena indigotica]KAF7288593.1 Zn-dependent hydrolase oxidoreductase family [Mycena indigotica]
MPIEVTETATQAAAREERAKAGRPAHWLNDAGTHFHNPWPSFRESVTNLSDVGGIIGTFAQAIFCPQSTARKDEIPRFVPDWAEFAPENDKTRGKVRATWLGHACFLVELPAPVAGARGPRILFDPVFSDRCSPSQIMGPKRYTKPPCKLDEVPEFDAIVISHNHYDHMDTNSLKVLLSRPSAPHVFAPYGAANQSYFRKLGVPANRTHCLDWWDARRVTTTLPSDKAASIAFDVTCTPGQHFTGRGLHDRCHTLWAGWVVESAPGPDDKKVKTTGKVYFAGDTGYRSVTSDTDDGPDDLPVCPAFKEIGERWGGMDLALIPIGAYTPRSFLSPVHSAPRDSVAIFKDVKARRGLGMHWGTWLLGAEQILDPPEKLAEEAQKAGLKEGAFTVCGIGETVLVDAGGK